ncbi:bifunctional folylpolyglutamate synthase/dihydrofolate synthase [Terriglobus sp. ADX1]|uniref:bifunctional folylpolyglutamate synthase/dihydrofolate synthase n=1 Tax=Terriglobus sp. ADX1 TaxID=2794063 RepID=UPI002FE6868F
MQYEEAVSKLYTLSGELAPAAPGAPRRKFELAHMRVLAEALGNPQNRYPSVLIAGTNGKGSTAATLASILSVSGYRIGLYTSPHLLRPNERIQISGTTPGENSLTEIGDDAFAAAFAKVEATATQLVSEGKLPHAPSFFEVITAIAFVAFAESKVDIAVLEVGLGGRLDATNIVEPLLSVITDISLDHTEWLGNTLTEIAREKAGILRPKGRLVTLPQHPEANAAIGEVAVSLDVTGVNAAAYLPDRITGDISYPLVIQGEGITVASPLLGDHQRRNVALAIAVSEQLLTNQQLTRITPRSIESGIQRTRWPGRLESITIPGTQITMLMDVAHNPAGAWTLRSHLSRQIDGDHLPAPRTLVFSALKDKSIREMAQILFPLFDGPDDRILLAPIHSPRAATAEALAEVATELDTTAEVCASVADAMNKAVDRAGSVIVSGSVYLVAEAKTWLKERRG